MSNRNPTMGYMDTATTKKGQSGYVPTTILPGRIGKFDTRYKRAIRGDEV
jgi:hypothetical protein